MPYEARYDGEAIEAFGYSSLAAVSQPAKLTLHDTANYGTTMLTRGNVSWVRSNGVVSCVTPDLTGSAKTVTGTNGTVTVDNAAAYRYAAPEVSA